MSEALEKTLKQATQCDLRFDAHSRQLYATDASIYELVPVGVALPKSAEEVREVLEVATAEGVPVIPRGGGTGLAGGAIGEGLVLDLARYNRDITEFNPEAKTVRVGTGVVLDELNTFLQPHGLCFGPDVATSSRATFGGMIGNNSSGARVPVYGTTIDHVHSIDVIRPEGTLTTLAPGMPLDVALLGVQGLVQAAEARIKERFHTGIIKRWPGYGVDRFLRDNLNMVRLFGGSEGTLGAAFSAELNLCPLPKEKGMGLLFFDSVSEAMEATVEILDLKPSAIEHIDDVLFDQTAGQLQFAKARQLLRLDEDPCVSIILVEFLADVEEKLELLRQKNLGLRTHLCRDGGEMAAVMNMRKAGLSLLTGCKGGAKPTAGIEDVAVPPAKLPEYVAGLQGLMKPLGLHGSFYGHCASGLLHVRPVVDLHDAGDIAKFRSLAEGVSALTKQFKGSLAAEHGVGIARTEFMEDQMGPELLQLMRDIKAQFDPKGIMNPGKIFPEGGYKIDTHLRWGHGYKIDMPFEARVGFVKKDHDFVGNLEQCNGCGGCRKPTPTMCPTYLATGEDLMATRGRANTIRAVLDGRLDSDDPLASEALMVALQSCLSCKACKTECPSNVDMALMKAQLLHAKYKKHGMPLHVKMMGRVDRLGEMASIAPGLSNVVLQSTPMRKLLGTMLGISSARPLPRYGKERFDVWFKKHSHTTSEKTVMLWDDCFVRHNEPEVGKAAVHVLEALECPVVLPENRACCGRPAFSLGDLDTAKAMAEENVKRFSRGTEPILFLEPSCYSMVKEDYAELGVAGASALSARAMLFEDFVADALDENPDALEFKTQSGTYAIHRHCHSKALVSRNAQAEILARVPGLDVETLDTGCCGMAGAFGAMDATYDLSMQVAEHLKEQLSVLPKDAVVIASGTSCRHQLEHVGDKDGSHIAVVLAEALGE